MAHASLFSGTDGDIGRGLGLRSDQHLKQKSVCLMLSERGDKAQASCDLVTGLARRISQNVTGRVPSRENWRLERKLSISPQNRSPEVVLERTIAVLGDRGLSPSWYNQMPVASGVVSDRSDKRAAVDLVNYEDGQADFIELKWASDTPAYAAFEILRYGLAYLVCRERAAEFQYQSKELMGLTRLSLVVLAPTNFYEPFDLSALAEGIRAGLRELSDRCLQDVELSFSFTSFPDDFQLPFVDGASLLSCQDGDLSRCGDLIAALGALRPVWE